MPNGLHDFIEDARGKKVSDEQIKSALINAGWPEDKITHALSEIPQNASLLPPPPVPHVGMWTGFLYIIFFPSLYTLATSMGSLFHSAVDKYIPNPSQTNNFLSAYSTNATRYYLAALIVSYIVFIILALILKKQLVEQPHVRNFRFRKIMIYITLVVTFLIIICYLVGYVYSLLDGSTTTNMLGHLGVTVLIAGSIFWYYLNEVKNDRK